MTQLGKKEAGCILKRKTTDRRKKANSKHRRQVDRRIKEYHIQTSANQQNSYNIDKHRSQMQRIFALHESSSEFIRLQTELTGQIVNLTK